MEKLTEENSKKETTISSLRTQVQKLVRRAGKVALRGGPAQGGVAAPALLRQLLRPWQARSPGAQLEALEEEVQSLQRILKSITEVQVLGPSRGRAAEALGS